MRDDAVESHPAHRVVEIALEQRHIPDAVGCAVVFRQAHRPWIDIDAPRMPRKSRRGQGRDTAAGPELQQRLARRLRQNCQKLPRIIHRARIHDVHRLRPRRIARDPQPGDGFDRDVAEIVARGRRHVPRLAFAGRRASETAIRATILPACVTVICK